MTIGDAARTLPDRIYFPEGSFQRPDFMPWLIHELTHVWQYQRGASLGGLIIDAIDAHYDYEGEDGLRKAWNRGSAFDDFTYEQQADILSDYYTHLGRKDLSAYEGFVDQVRTGETGKRRAQTVTPLPGATLDWKKSYEQDRVKTEGELIRQLRIPMKINDERAVVRAQRLLELFSHLSGYWSGTYAERLVARRTDDELVTLLFSTVSDATLRRILRVFGVNEIPLPEPGRNRESSSKSAGKLR